MQFNLLEWVRNAFASTDTRITNLTDDLADEATSRQIGDQGIASDVAALTLTVSNKAPQDAVTALTLTVQENTGAIGQIPTLYQSIAKLGQPGYAPKLNEDGVLPTNNLPPVAIITVYPVNTVAEMLALGSQVQQGDVAAVNALDATRGSYMRKAAGPANTLEGWQLLVSPTDAVTSVDGRQGVIVLNDRYLSLTGGALSGGLVVNTSGNTTAIHIGSDATGADTRAINFQSSRAFVGHDGTREVAYLRGSAAKGIALDTNNLERLRILANGNVGIATVAPATPLHVIGAIRAETAAGGLTSELTGNNLEFNRANAESYIVQKGLGGVLTIRTSVAAVSDTLAVQIYANGEMRLPADIVTASNSAATKRYVDAQIQTRLPTANANATSNFTFSGSGEVSIDKSGTANSILRFKDEGVETGAIYSLNDENIFRVRAMGDLQLASNGTSGGLAFIYAKANVGVGVGTTSPAYTLDVNGQARVASNLFLGAVPTGDSHATRKKYVDDLVLAAPYTKRFELDPLDTGGTRRWVRLATMDGVTAQGGAQFLFLLSGTGDYGKARRGTMLVHATQRGDNSVFVKVWGFGVADTLDPVEFYTVQLSTYVFEIWIRTADFTSNHSIHQLSNTRTVVNFTSADESGTAPVGVSEQYPVLDMEYQSDELLSYDGNGRRVGQDCLDPRNHTAITTPNGQITLTYFTAKRTETLSRIQSRTRQTAAAATPTLCKMAIYTADANDNLMLLGSTANDTTMWNGTYQTVTRALAAPIQLVRGQRYAFATLITTTATAPVLVASASSFVSQGDDAGQPRLYGKFTGQTDMPASIAIGSITSQDQGLYGALLP